MKHLAFSSISDIFGFLEAQRGRGGWTRVRVTPTHYRLEVADDWLPAGPVFGAKLEDPVTTGREMEIAELLRSLPLRDARSEGRAIKTDEVLLAISTDSCGTEKETQNARTAAQSRLFEAAKLIKCGEATDTFWYLPTPLTRGGFDCVYLRGIAGRQDWDAFKEEARRLGVRLFLPVEGREGAPFMIEAGFVHPTPRLLLRLHPLSSDERLICAAGDPVGAGAAWRQALWHKLPDSGMPVSAMVDLTPGPGHLAGEWEIEGSVLEEQLNRIHVDVAIGSVDRSIGSVFDLEGRIASHQAEIERLQSARERLGARASGDYVPVFLWKQDVTPDADGQPAAHDLPAGLEAFLRQPFSQLEQYRYAPFQCVESDESGGGGDRHYVLHFMAGEQPMPGGDALAVRCDHVFLQDVRWQAWGLPLFVRADCALNIDLNEQEMADAFKASVLTPLNAVASTNGAQTSDDFDQKVLLAPERGLLAPASMGPMHAIVLRGLSRVANLGSLTSNAVQWLNHWGGSEMKVTTMQRADARFRIEEFAIEADQQTLALDDRMSQRISTLTGEVERTWEEFRKKARHSLTAAHMGNMLLKATDEHYRALPASWIDFVTNVIATNRAVAQDKTEAMARWDKQLGEIEKEDMAVRALLAEVEKLLPEALQEIERRRKELEKLVEQTEQKTAEMRARLEELPPLEAELQSKGAQLSAMSKRLGEDVRAAQQRAAQAEKDLQSIREREQQLAQLKAQDTARREQQEQVNRACDQLEEEVQRERELLRDAQAHATESEMPLAWDSLKAEVQAAMRILAKKGIPTAPDRPDSSSKPAQPRSWWRNLLGRRD